MRNITKKLILMTMLIPTIGSADNCAPTDTKCKMYQTQSQAMSAPPPHTSETAALTNNSSKSTSLQPFTIPLTSDVQDEEDPNQIQDADAAQTNQEPRFNIFAPNTAANATTDNSNPQNQTTSQAQPLPQQKIPFLAPKSPLQLITNKSQ